MRRYWDHSLLDIVTELRGDMDRLEAGDIIVIEAVRPELKGRRPEGTAVDVDGHPARARSLKAWVTLFELLGGRLLTPEIVDEQWMRLSFQKLSHDATWHDMAPGDPTEKYGASSPFACIDKREDPAYLEAFSRAFKSISLPEAARILDVGVNSGDEIALMRRLLPDDLRDTVTFLGIDHSKSAVKTAKERFKGKYATFLCLDINRVESLTLDPFDFILSIGTLQSPGIDFKRVFMSLIQRLLSPNGAVILGFPNCRYIDGEVISGAKVKNYSEPELSLLVKDIYFVKKYLQQHRFTVTLFGTHYLFLTGVRSVRC